jgi:arabinosaccharide transport system substrate-binding protein
MKKITVAMLSLLLVFSLVLAACGGNSSNSGQSGSSGSSSGSSSSSGGSQSGGSAQPTKLTLWTFQDQHKTYFEDALARWNAQNPDKPIDLSIETYPNEDMHNKLLIALQSGVGAPDITDVNINFFHNYLKGDIQLLELNDVIEPELDKFITSRFDIYAKDGKYYGIDFHVGITVVYYNKEILEKAGVNADDIVTWNDYIEAGKKVVAATGVPMTAFEVTDQRPFWPLIVQRGGDYLDANGNVALDSDINIEILQTMKDMINEHGIAIPMPGGRTSSEEFFAFMNNGGIASLIMPSWYMSRFLDYMPDLAGKVLVRPMPVWDSTDAKSVGIGGTGTAVTAQTKHPELAKEFLAYAKLSRESNIRIWEILKFDPIRWDVWDAPELMQADPYFNNEKIFEVFLQLKDDIRSPNMGILSSAAQDIVKNQVMFKVLQEQSESPEQALKAAANELRKQQ